MSKGQKRSNKEARKPKASKEPNQNPLPSTSKDRPVGITTLKS